MDSERLTNIASCRFADAEIAALDDDAKGRPIPGRSEVIRALVKEGLEPRAKPKGGKR